MNYEVAWVLVFSEIQVQLQKILDPDYLPDYPFLMTMIQFKFSVADVSLNLPEI